MGKAIKLKTIGNNEYFYDGTIFYVRKKLGNNRVSKLTRIRAITLIRILLNKL